MSDNSLVGNESAFKQNSVYDAGLADRDVPDTALPANDGTPRNEANHGASRRRSVINATHDEHEVNAEAISALAAAGGLYQRSGRLVEVLREDGKAYCGASIREIPQAVLQSRVSERIEFRTTSGNNSVRCHPPDWCVRYLFSAGSWPGIPPLTSIIETPSIRPDGTVIQTPGYDPTTGCFYTPSEEFDEIPQNPSQSDAWEALRALREVFQDFPFRAGTADRDVPIAAVLTLVARPAIRGACPAFLFDASMSRSGKGYISNAISIIALGRTFAPTNFPGSRDELEKVLGGYAMRGVPLIAFDNLEGVTFGGGPIERAVTAEDRIALRVLGRSDVPELAWRTVIIATGNNVECTRDMSARVIRARLEPACERPEDRDPTQFAHYPLLPWVEAERARLVVAALTIVRAYFVAGRPTVAGTRAVSDFGAWASVVRDALVWAGGEDVGQTRAAAATTDTKGTALKILLQEMNDGSARTAREWLDSFKGFDDSGVLDAVDELCLGSREKEVTARALGYAFRSALGRVVNGMRLVQAGDATKSGVRWRVEKVS